MLNTGTTNASGPSSGRFEEITTDGLMQSGAKDAINPIWNHEAMQKAELPTTQCIIALTGDVTNIFIPFAYIENSTYSFHDKC